jgi:c-di-GMP-binding flagellar brake protein YcgR
MKFWKEKTNCWEYKECGLGPGGDRVAKEGLCPAAADAEANGMNGGVNGGRVCWAVTGTFCHGQIQGEFAEKQLGCLRCGFFQHMLRDAGRSFKLVKKGQADTGTLINGRKTILALMGQAHREKLLFNVSIGDEPDVFVSMLLGVYPKHDLIVFDELNSASGHRLLLENKILHAVGRLNGAELHFTTTLVKVGNKNGVAFYQLEMPRCVYYLQLRQAYRVTLFGDKLPFVAHMGTSGRKLSGYVVDISVGGVGVVLDQYASLHNGQILDHVVMILPEIGNVSVALKVCFTRHNRERDVTRFGAQFYDVDKLLEEKIAKFINGIQRKQVQHK